MADAYLDSLLNIQRDPAEQQAAPTGSFDLDQALGIRRVQQNKGTGGDVVTSLKRGVLELPSVAAGLADLPIALATGATPISDVTGKIGEMTGIQPKKWADEAKQEYSAGYQKGAAEVSKAWDTWSPGKIAKAYLTNPGQILNLVAESAPSMVAGGGIAGGVLKAGGGALVKAVGEKAAVAIAAGAGEGVVQAGQAMSDYQGTDNRRGAVAALASGLVDAVIGAGAGRVAQGLGLETAETAIAKSFNRQMRKELVTGAAAKGKKIAGGAISEGILQELPQSAQEQVAANWANKKPLWEGVPRSAVEGALSGFVMGAGANVPGGRTQAGIDRAQENILKRAVPGGREVSVKNGLATVSVGSPDSPTVVTAPVETMLHHISQGKPVTTMTAEQRFGDRGLFTAAATGPETVAQDEAEANAFGRESLQYWQERNAPITPEAAASAAKNSAMDTLVDEYSPELPAGFSQADQRQVFTRTAGPETVPLEDTEATQFGREALSRTRAANTVQQRRAALGTEYSTPPMEESLTRLYYPETTPGVQPVNEQRRTFPGTSGAEVVSPEDATANQFGREALRQNQVRNTQGLRRSAVGASTTPETVQDTYIPDLPIQTPEATERNLAGLEESRRSTPTETYSVFKDQPLTQVMQAAETAVDRQMAPPAGLALPDVSARLQRGDDVYSAFTEAAPPVQRRDGAGFKTENALRVNATKKGVSLSNYEVLNTPNGYIAVPKPYTASQAQQDVYWGEVGKKHFPEDWSQADEQNLQSAKAVVARSQGETLFNQSAPVAGTTSARVRQEITAFLGDGAENLSMRGKLRIVQSQDELPKNITQLASGGAKIAGMYRAQGGKIYLVADNIRQGSVEGIVRHEAVHALLREDKAFMKNRAAILSSFEKLSATDKSVKAAFARVPMGTAANIQTEEALAYWQQEKSNHKHSLFKRIVAAVKAGLARLGLHVKNYSAADLSRLFSAGTQAWSMEGMDSTSQNTDILFSIASESIKTSNEAITTAVRAMRDPRSTAHDWSLQHAPQIFAMTPDYHIIAERFKEVPQTKQFADATDRLLAVKKELMNTSKAKFDHAMHVAKKGAGVDALNKAAGYASYYQMTPWDDIMAQEWVPQTKAPREARLREAGMAWTQAKMKEATGKTFAQAYAETRAAYDALGSQDLKDAYKDVVADVAHLRKREMTNLKIQIERVKAYDPTLAAKFMAQFDATFKNLKGAYLPLTRYGGYTLSYKGADGTQVDEQSNSVQEHNAKLARAIETGADPATIKEGHVNEQTRGVGGVSQELMAQLHAAVEAKYLSEVDINDEAAIADAQSRAQDLADSMNQVFFRWQPETSALKNSIRRKSRKGFDTDMMRGYLTYVQNHASNIAWTEQGKKLEESMSSLSSQISETRRSDGRQNTMMSQHLLNDMRKRYAAMKTSKVGAFASAAARMTTGWYMTSPSIALVQMSQLGALTFPKLSVMYKSAGKAMAALARGTAAAFSKDFTREAMFADPQVNEVYNNIHARVEDGDVTEGKMLGDKLYTDDQKQAQIRKLTDKQRQLLVLRESLARNLLDVSAAHEAYQLTQGKNPNSVMNKVFHYAMLPMSLSELASRKATILATMELAESGGKNFQEAMADISEVVNKTLFTYDKEQRGAALQGSTARVLLQFQQYRMLAAIRIGLLFRDMIRHEDLEARAAARKEFLGIMGMSAAMAGTLGLPLAGQVFGALSLVMGDEDEPEDPQMLYEQWAREQFGDRMGDVLLHGLPAAAGANLTRRIGLSGLYGMQQMPPSWAHGQDLMNWWAAYILGPSWGVVSDIGRGYDQAMNKGQYLRGLETALPKPLRDGLKATRAATEGLKTVSGKQVVARENIGADDVLMLALGFYPEEIAKAQTADMQVSGLSTAISERRGRLMTAAVQAVIGGGDLAEATAAIRQFNRKMPKFAIRGGDLRSRLRQTILSGEGRPGQRERMVRSQYEVVE